jgi:hypothetical protein
MEQQTMPLAIIGMACRFAGDVTSPEQLWQLCVDGKSAWKAIPESRFAQKELYHPDNQKQGTVRHLLATTFQKKLTHLFIRPPRQTLKEAISWRKMYPSSMPPFLTSHLKWLV